MRLLFLKIFWIVCLWSCCIYDSTSGKLLNRAAGNLKFFETEIW